MSSGSPWAFSTVLSPQKEGQQDLYDIPSTELILRSRDERYIVENGKPKDPHVSSQYGTVLNPKVRDKQRQHEEKLRKEKKAKQKRYHEKEMKIPTDDDSRLQTFDYWKTKCLRHEQSMNEGLRKATIDARDAVRKEKRHKEELLTQNERVLRKIAMEIENREKADKQSYIAKEKMKIAKAKVEELKEEIEVWKDRCRRERLTRRKIDLRRIRVEQRLTRERKAYESIPYCDRCCTAFCWCWCTNEESCCHCCYTDPLSRIEPTPEEQMGPTELLDRFGTKLEGKDATEETALQESKNAFDTTNDMTM
eukprot:g1787.t1